MWKGGGSFVESCETHVCLEHNHFSLMYHSCISAILPDVCFASLGIQLFLRSFQH